MAETSDVVKGAIPVREVDAVLRDFWRKGEIKSLDHWRKLDEVAAEVLTGVETPPPAPPWWDDGWEKVEPSRWRLVPSAPARAPFPARALRDRPWDISALVEE